MDHFSSSHVNVVWRTKKIKMKNIGSFAKMVIIVLRLIKRVIRHLFQNYKSRPKTCFFYCSYVQYKELFL